MMARVTERSIPVPPLPPRFRAFVHLLESLEEVGRGFFSSPGTGVADREDDLLVFLFQGHLDFPAFVIVFYCVAPQIWKGLAHFLLVECQLRDPDIGLDLKAPIFRERLDHCRQIG